VINAILTSRFNRIKVTVDGKRIARGSMVLCTFANGRRVGKDLIDIYIDGEQLPGSQFHLKILPGALPLRLPKKS
jgi:diacylglycerol kinase family enzyme